jgi:hypothetical protein
VETTCLASQIRIQVVHEPGKLLGVSRTQKKVVMIGEKHKRVQIDIVEPPSSSQDPDGNRPHFS